MNHRIAVNPIKCKGFGMCGELLPERIKLDEWGYPVIDGKPISEQLREHAERAMRECPTAALFLDRPDER